MFDHEIVKRVRAISGDALYFSRAPLPWPATRSRSTSTSASACRKAATGCGISASTVIGPAFCVRSRPCRSRRWKKSSRSNSACARSRPSHRRRTDAGTMPARHRHARGPGTRRTLPGRAWLSACRLLIVCRGNICRSPMAEGALRARLRAAGLEPGRARLGRHRRLACRRSAGSAQHRTGRCTRSPSTTCAGRKLPRRGFQRFDWLLCADRSVLRDVRAAMPAAAHAQAAWLMNGWAGRGRRDSGSLHRLGEDSARSGAWSMLPRWRLPAGSARPAVGLTLAPTEDAGKRRARSPTGRDIVRTRFDLHSSVPSSREPQDPARPTDKAPIDRPWKPSSPRSSRNRWSG